MGTHPIFESDFDCLTMIGRTLSRRTMILSVNRAGGKTSQQFNAGSTSSCGNYINGGNPLNNYHQADYWKKRHAMCTYPVLGGAFVCFLGWLYRQKGLQRHALDCTAH